MGAASDRFLWILWWGAGLVLAVMLDRKVVAAVDATVLATSIAVAYWAESRFRPRAAKAEIANRRLAESTSEWPPAEPSAGPVGWGPYGEGP